MAEFVNQQYAAEAQREEQLRQQQMGQLVSQAGQIQNQAMQRAHLQMAQQAAEEQKKSQQLEFFVKMGTMSGLQPAVRADFLNQGFKLMGYDGQVTEAGIDPVGTAMKGYVENYNKTGKLDPTLPLFIESAHKHNLIQAGSAETIAQLETAYNQQQAAEVVSQLNRPPTEVEEAGQWIAQNEVPAQNAARQIIQAEMDTSSGVTGLVGDVETKALSPQEAAHQQWFEGHAAEVKQTSGIDITEGLAKPAAMPAPTETPAIISGGAADWLTDQRDLFNTYKQKQAIVRSDEARQGIAQKQTAWLAAHPEELKKAGAGEMQWTLGVPMGVNQEELIKARYWKMKAEGGPKNEKDRVFYEAAEPHVMSGEQLNAQRAEVLQERLKEGARKSQLYTQAQGLTTQTELQAYGNKLKEEKVGIQEKLKQGGLKDEELAGLMAQDKALDQQLAALPQAQAQEAQGTIAALQARKQDAMTDLNRLKGIQARAPLGKLGPVHQQMNELNEEIKLTDQLSETFTTYGQGNIMQREAKLADGQTLLGEVNKNIKTADAETVGKLLIERDRLTEENKKDQEWLDTANEKQQVAKIRLNSHIKRVNGNNSALVRQQQAQAYKDDKDLKLQLGIQEYIQRRRVNGEASGPALAAVGENYPGIDLNKVHTAFNGMLNDDAKLYTPVAQGQFAHAMVKNPNADKLKTALGIHEQWKGRGVNIPISDIQDIGPKGAKEGGGGFDFKDYQQAYTATLNQAAKLTGQSGLHIGTGVSGLPEVDIGTVKDPLKLADMVEELTSAQVFLPPQVKQALVNTVTSLRKTKAPAAAAAAPAMPAAPPADVEERLRQKYLK